MSHKAIFLDRDGTIIENVPYLSDSRNLKFYDVFDQILLLQQHGFKLFVITNQSGIARRYYSIKQYKRINERFLRILKKAGIKIQQVYFCPHYPKPFPRSYRRECDCRKPKPGMILKAIKTWNIDPAKSYVIGDSERDIEAGQRLNIPGFLIHHQSKESKGSIATPAITFAEAIKRILTLSKRQISSRLKTRS